MEDDVEKKRRQQEVMEEADSRMCGEETKAAG
jgi:hypothetical protein